MREELPVGSKAHTPGAGASAEAAPDKKKRRRKRRRRGKPREDVGVTPMALEPLHPSSDDGDLHDEWADDLPPLRASAKRGRLELAAGGAPPPAQPAAGLVPPSPAPAPPPAPPARVLAKHSSRERSPRRAEAQAEQPLVAGCLATVHGLDSRADLNGSQELLLSGAPLFHLPG